MNNVKNRLKQRFILEIMENPKDWMHGTFSHQGGGTETVIRNISDQAEVKFWFFGCTIYPKGTAYGIQSYGYLTKRKFKKIAKALDVYEQVLNEKENEKETVTVLNSFQEEKNKLQYISK